VQTTIEQRREWLALLEAELARRTAKAQWEAGEDERQAERLLDELRQMAERQRVVGETHPVAMFDLSYGHGPPQLVEDLSAAGRLARALFGPLEPERQASEEAWLDEWFERAGYTIRITDFR